MSIATEIQRLQTAKEEIKTSIENKGVTVPPNATLDKYSDYVDQITVGGGDDNLVPYLEGSLTAITASMLQGITSLRNYAFAYVTNLKKVELPNGLTKIPSYAFYSSQNLESVTIPNSVTTCGSYTFQGCSSLTGVTIPASITSTKESSVFWNCGINYSATTGCNITILSKNYDLGNDSFYNCPANLYLNGPITGNTTSPSTSNNFLKYVSYSISNCLIRNITLGPDVNTAYNYTFYSGGSIQSVDMSECTGLTELTYYMFGYCTGMTSVVLPPNITKIDNSVFWTCRGLTGNLTIPSTVTSIGDNAFYNCSKLTSITVLATTPPTLGSSAFYGTTCLIYVPSESVEAYKAASVWSNYADRIQAIPN